MEHKRQRRHAAGLDAASRMGVLIHDLRNALCCVFAAQAMIGKVAADDGHATAMLERNLRHMRSILDRAEREILVPKEPKARRPALAGLRAARPVAARS
jgi:hypothetical protein